ncbi:hypothetical protein NQ176_g9687 [Zarea fungicola]|uniref:Uncharacterized protein n=1 Tax=Zarea fungicola TaxID=93591 RepID=A0ACC1MKL6_9HYPO|nr:hypothetical protein NQ176_g9687 [Lecanicillium fungicola]
MSNMSSEKVDTEFDMEHEAEKTMASTPELYIDPVKQKQLLRKLDIWIAPVMTIMFLSAYLDRSNIGNAASGGMTKDLNMTDGELGNAVTLFYVTYVAAEIPCSLVLKKFHPSQ